MADKCTLCDSEMNKNSKLDKPYGIIKVASKEHGVLYRCIDNEIICGACSDMIYDTPKRLKLVINNSEIDIINNGLEHFCYEYKFTIDGNVLHSPTSYLSIETCIREAIHDFKCETLAL